MSQSPPPRRPRFALPIYTLTFLFVIFAGGGPSGPSHAGEWRLEGDLGFEVESVTETFSVPDTMIDTVHVDPDTPIEEQLESVRFRDHDALTDGLLRLELSYLNPVWDLSFQSRLATGSGRTREILECEMISNRPQTGRLILRNDFYGQSGGGESQDGFQNETSLSWHPPGLHDGWDLRWRNRWEHSKSWGDSISRVFNYDRARTGMRLRKNWGWSRELWLELEWGGKWLDESTVGSYNSLITRMGTELSMASNLPLSATYSFERRRYKGSNALTNSFREHILDLYITRRALGESHLESRMNFHYTDYDTTGTIFFDNVQCEGSILLRRHLFGDWSLKTGPGGGWLTQVESGGAGSYQTAYLQLEVSYEPIRHGWFNATTRWGRRDYTEASSSQIIVFEGYNLSLARSDYTFASLSLLGDVELGWGLSIEGFLQYDLEWHDSADDDFKLSTLTLRIARDL